MKTTFRSKRDLSPQHIIAFYKVLERIGKHIDLDWENIRKQFRGLKWPKRDDLEATFLAVDLLTAVDCLPFELAIAVVGPPSVVSASFGLLEFRIYDCVAKLSPSMYKANTAVSLSVFQSGREVLRVPGLTLDSTGELTKYPERQLAVDKFIVRQNIKTLALLRNLIAEFPATDELGRRCQANALEDLNGPLRPMFG